MGNENILEIKDISKSFPGVKALDNVSFNIKRGEVHALCGENGAGKSTLMHILSGIYHQETGDIIIDGSKVFIENQTKAQKMGVSTVYQERSLVDNLSIAENIFAGRQPVSRSGMISWKKLYRETEELLELLEFKNLNPKTLVGKLPPAKQQMVEMAKALSINAKILILDEPTATITENEINTLFDVIRSLQTKGISIIYISHRLSEIFEIADRVSVLKDGKYMGTRNVTEIESNDIVAMMVGRKLFEDEHVSSRTDEIVLEVKDFTTKMHDKVSFNLKKGEILSFSGLAGAGRTELVRAMIGADRSISGKVIVSGHEQKIRTPQDAIRAGIGYMPEDRKEQGLFLEMSIADNIYSANINFEEDRKSVNRKSVRKVAEGFKAKLNIVTPDVDRRVVFLSGGNQQKVVLAKWLLLDPGILIVDEPTRGVDVGAKAEIYRILKDLAAKGTSIIVISSDLPEVLSISDRIMVMWNGRFTGELERESATEELIMHYASGIEADKSIQGNF